MTLIHQNFIENIYFTTVILHNLTENICFYDTDSSEFHRDVFMTLIVQNLIENMFYDIDSSQSH